VKLHFSTVFPLLVLWLTAFFPQSSFAQSPLWDEDPSLLPEGRSVIRLGGDYAWIGDGRRLFRLPAIYWKTGLGGIAEWIALFNLGEAIQDGKKMGYDVETLIVGTKIHVYNSKGKLPETALGFGVKIPSQDTRKGMGPDTTDIYARAMFGESFGSTRVSVNLGIGILEKISETLGQDDIFTYGISLDTPISSVTDLLLELNGHTNSSRQPTQNFVLVGFRFSGGKSGRWDIAGIWGLNPSADDFRLTLGYTTDFKLF